MKFVLFLFPVVLVAAGCDQKPNRLPAAAVPVDEPAAKRATITVDAPKPQATDPAATEAIAKMLIAHCKGNIAALKSLTHCTVQRTGELNQGGQMNPAQCLERYSWPGRYRGEWTYGNSPVCTFFIQDETVKFYAPAAGHTEPVMPGGRESIDALEDLRGMWMTMLVPLADPADYLAERIESADPGRIALRLWVKTHAPCVLVLNGATHQLESVTFDKTGDGRRETWTYELADLKPVNGVLLPHRLIYSAGKQTGAIWKQITYTPGTGFEPGTFEKP